MDYSDTYDELNITLGDNDDVTFTPEEKARALKKAWNDPYVVKVVWDSTLTFSSSSYYYTLPTTLDTIKGIYLSSGNSVNEFPEPIDSSLWEVINGRIQFSPAAANVIPDGYTLYLKGNYKYDWNTDTLATTSMQEYVISLAGYNTLTLLGYKKANLFLKNDTSMAELITLKRDLKDDVREARAKLLREFERV